MRRVRKLLIFLSLVIIVNNSTAQTKVQRGVARMITRTATDPIVPVQGVQVVVGNVANKASDKSGRFTMNIAVNKEQSYQVADVRLPKGSTLLLASPSKKKKLFLSKNDLEVALITPEDKNTVSKATYRKLLKKYNQQAEQLRLLRTQLEDKRLELEENSTEYAKLTSRIDSIQDLLNQYFDEQNRDNTTKEIERIAEELALTDYQSLEAEEAKIYDLTKEGDWPTLSAYLLKLMNGDAAAYIQEAVNKNNAAKKIYEQTAQELATRLERLKSAIKTFEMQNLNDSVSYYYEILCNADSTNWWNLKDAGNHEYYSKKYFKSLQYYQKALCHSATSWQKRWIYDDIACVYSNMKNYPMTIQYAEKALDLHLESNDSISRNDASHLYDEIAFSYFGLRNYIKAICYFQKCIDEYKRRYRIRADENIEFYNEKIVECYLLYGDSISKKNYTESLEFYQKALELLGGDHLDLAKKYYSIGVKYYCKDDYVKAMEYYQKALNIRLRKLGENNADVADNYHYIGHVYRAQGDYVKALEYYQKALNIRLNIFGENNIDVADEYSIIGNIHSAQGNYASALESYHKALNIYIQRNESLGDNYSQVAMCYNDIGCAYYYQGDYAKALECHKNALNNNLTLLKRVPAIKTRTSNDIAISYYNIGKDYESLGDYVNALKYFQKEVNILKAKFGENNPQTLSAIGDLNNVSYRNALQNTDAAKMFMASHAIIGNVLDNTPASQRGLKGTYYLLSFDRWTVETDTTDIFAVNDNLRGKPKTVAFYRDGEIREEQFENLIGAQLEIKNIDEQEKQKMVEVYRRWKSEKTEQK